MRCDQFEFLLHSWMDDTLAPEETIALRAHADACPLCAELAAALREALALCRDMGNEAQVPQAAGMAWRQAVRAEATGNRAGRRFSLPRWETWAGLAAGILVLIGGANLIRYGRVYLEPTNNTALHQPGEFMALPEMPMPPMAAPEADQMLASRALGVVASESLSEAEMLWPDEDADTGGYMAIADNEASFAFEPEADASPTFSPLIFLRDAGIFLALCMPPVAIAFCIARLCKRRKKARKRPKQ